MLNSDSVRIQPTVVTYQCTGWFRVVYLIQVRYDSSLRVPQRNGLVVPSRVGHFNVSRTVSVVSLGLVCQLWSVARGVLLCLQGFVCSQRCFIVSAGLTLSPWVQFASCGLQLAAFLLCLQGLRCFHGSSLLPVVCSQRCFIVSTGLTLSPWVQFATRGLLLAVLHCVYKAYAAFLCLLCCGLQLAVLQTVCVYRANAVSNMLINLVWSVASTVTLCLQSLYVHCFLGSSMLQFVVSSSTYIVYRADEVSFGLV